MTNWTTTLIVNPDAPRSSEFINFQGTSNPYHARVPEENKVGLVRYMNKDKEKPEATRKECRVWWSNGVPHVQLDDVVYDVPIVLECSCGKPIYKGEWGSLAGIKSARSWSALLGCTKGKGLEGHLRIPAGVLVALLQSAGYAVHVDHRYALSDAEYDQVNIPTFHTPQGTTPAVVCQVGSDLRLA